MTTTGNKEMASKALLDLDSIRNTIKEESKSTLKALLSEAVKDYVREAAEDEDEEDVEIIDNDKEVADDNDFEKEIGCDVKDDEVAPDSAEDVEEPASDALEAPEGEGENDEWTEFNQYRMGDDENSYDFTGEKDYNQVVKVFKLMNDDDVVKVVNDGENVNIKDSKTGAEYLIDLNNDEEGEAMTEGRINEGEFDDVFGDEDDDFGSEDENEYTFEYDDDFGDNVVDNEDNFAELLSDDEDVFADDENIAGLPAKNYNEGKMPRNTMKENEELAFEVEIDEKPFKAGKSKKAAAKPFDKKVDEETEPIADEELEEAAMSCSSQADAKATKSNKSTPRFNHIRKGAKVVSVAGEKKEVSESYKAVAESLLEENKRLREALKAKKDENKELKEAIYKVRIGLHEQRVTTVNLAKITKLFVENAVSQKEKEDIINRFSNEAKTIEQSKALYESINKELKKGPKQNANINESSMTVSSKPVTENKVQRTKDLLETLDFIKRMENC